MSLSTLQIPVARAFKPFLAPSRYKAAYGGRGSGKSHFFAGNLLQRALNKPGFRGVCVREVQKDLKESAKLLIEDKIGYFGLSQFSPQTAEIRTPGGGLIIFRGMQDYNAESIKSLEGFDVAWVEEAHTLSARSLELLRPTIREEGSELWFSWNPRWKADPVDALFRGKMCPDSAIVIRVSYGDNPWLNDVLREERREAEEKDPDRYGHIWLGDYAPAALGAYYAKELAAAERENRIGRVPWEPVKKVHTCWDLGVGDNTAIWFFQLVNNEVRWIDYHEASGVGLADYVKLLREKPYVYGEHLWPHDGGVRELGSGVSREETANSLGLRPRVCALQSVDDGINAVRLLLPRSWFDADKCERGIEALRQYRADYDEKGQTLKPRPVHDWASHPADAMRTGAMNLPPVNDDWGKMPAIDTGWVR